MKISMHEILTNVLNNNKVNLVRFDKGKSEGKNQAALRAATGETIRDESMGHARLFSPKVVGLKRDNLFVTVGRDKSTKQDDGSFDYRTIPVASPTFGNRVPFMEVLFNFQSEWHEIDFSNCPVFPELPMDKSLWFAETMMAIDKLRCRKNFLDNVLKNLKKKLDKENEVVAIGHRFHWQKPEGMKRVVVNHAGIQVKTVATKYKNGAQLIPQLPKSQFDSITDTQEIVKVYLDRNEITEKLSELSMQVRPYELGIIERAGAIDTLSVGGLNFKVNRFSVSQYDLPDETMDNIENGTWVYKDIPKDKGSWKCDPINVPTSSIEVTVSA